MNSEQQIRAVLADPSTSNWVRDALEAALKRDPVDAANDSYILAQMLEKRCKEALAHAP